MCPHTTICVRMLRCVRIQLYVSCSAAGVRILLCMCPHAIMCPHATICVRMLRCLCPPSRRCRSMHTMCPHTTIYVSAYYYICVRILLYMCLHTSIMCPHPTIYPPAYCYTCARTLLYIQRPHTTIYVSSYLLKHQRAMVQRRCNRHPLPTVCVLILYIRYYICVFILLYMCPHTGAGTLFDSRKACPHTTVYILLYVSSYYYMCVLVPAQAPSLRAAKPTSNTLRSATATFKKKVHPEYL
jgi:hypothetical protein